MRIGIAGTHGAGKTMLAKQLSRQLGLPLIEEQARLVAVKLGVRHADDLLGDGALAERFQKAVLLQQLAAEGSRSSFVSDRTLYDCLVYWRYYKDLFGFDGTDRLGLDYENRCLGGGYDLVIYVPLAEDARLADDGFRSLDMSFARAVDRMLLDIFKEVAVPFAVVNGGPRERLAAALRAVERLGAARDCAAVGR